MASQVGAVADTVEKAYEKNVFVATIILLSIAVVALFTLLVKSYKDRGTELKETNETHRLAMEAKSKSVSAEFEKKDDRIFSLIERVTESMTSVSHNLQNFTEEIRELKGRSR
jgi:hypothetical protein